MRTKLRNKWVAALRSGKYKQGKSKLYNHKTGCHCVMGVLLDVIDPKGWFLDAWMDPKTQFAYSCLMPGAVLKRIGLSEEVTNALMMRNDTGDMNFEELARLIESRTGRQLGYHYWGHTHE